MKYLILGCMSSILFLSSCTVLQKTTAEPRTIEAYETRIIIKPLIAEVEVDITKKITGVATIKTNAGTVEQAKELAKWDAIEKSGADIIIDPMFKVTTTATTITAEVQGFYGKYSKISTIKDEDLENLNLYSTPTGSTEGQNSGSVMTRLKKLQQKDEQ